MCWWWNIRWRGCLGQLCQLRYCSVVAILANAPHVSHHVRHVRRMGERKETGV